jgi:penicillin-binding protein 1A
MGYTGNFVCGIWFGNDNYEPLNRMTGGSLPAMTWHAIMEYAHQGIEIKQLPGLPIPPARPQMIADKTKKDMDAPPPRPRLLTKRGADVLVGLERLFDDTSRTLGPVPTAGGDKQRDAGLKDAQDNDLTAALEGRAFVRN